MTASTDQRITPAELRAFLDLQRRVASVGPIDLSEMLVPSLADTDLAGDTQRIQVAALRAYVLAQVKINCKIVGEVSHELASWTHKVHLPDGQSFELPEIGDWQSIKSPGQARMLATLFGAHAAEVDEASEGEDWKEGSSASVDSIRQALSDLNADLQCSLGDYFNARPNAVIEIRGANLSLQARVPEQEMSAP